MHEKILSKSHIYLEKIPIKTECRHKNRYMNWLKTFFVHAILTFNALRYHNFTTKLLPLAALFCTFAALLQKYFLANEQCFSLTTNQYKPNFSETNRGTVFSQDDSARKKKLILRKTWWYSGCRTCNFKSKIKRHS